MRTYTNHPPFKNIHAILAIGDYYIHRFDNTRQGFVVQVGDIRYTFTKEYTESEKFLELIILYQIILEKVFLKAKTASTVKELTNPKNMKSRLN